MITVDIDVGGTLTDGIFGDGQRLLCCKVDTTSHDLTVCLFDCLNRGAAALGYSDLDTLLENVGLIRWSTTITSNVLAETSGPRVGLLISQGHERDLYGASHRSLLLGRLLQERDVMGLDGSPGRDHITSAVRSLLESGVRRICISLKAAHLDPEPEMRIKHVIDELYPDHFLGSVPVLAGSDISNSSDDMTRTCCSVLNAYTHGALAAALFKAEDELREQHHYSGSFLVSHVNGGMSGIAKAKAIDTVESGPVLGIRASEYFARVYDEKRVVALDVGGTTAKVSALTSFAPVQVSPSDFFGIPVRLSLPFLRSIGLGGGSVVRLDPEGEKGIALGPQSMGAFPGPACYSLGGDRPTLTDAFVAAGLINPEYFLGGARQLDAEASRKAIQEDLAQDLGLPVEETAALIINAAFSRVAHLVLAASSELKLDLSQHSLFAYGGNGGLFACGAAEKAGITRIYLFGFGAVFSAFGSSVSDISHVYERSLHGANVSTFDGDSLDRAIDEMTAEGIKDLLGEGIDPQGMECSLELEVSCPGRHAVMLSCPQGARTREELRTFLETQLETSAPSLRLNLARLRLAKPTPRPRLVERPLQSADPSPALTGSRQVAIGNSRQQARLYAWELLLPGNRIDGCAVIEGPNTTYFVPEGWTMTLDRYGNAKVTRQL